MAAPDKAPGAGGVRQSDDTEGAQDGADASASARPSSAVRPYLIVLLGTFLLAVLTRVFVMHAYRIPSASMEDTLLVGDYLLAERITFGATVELPRFVHAYFRLPAIRHPDRGDVVIFRAWENSGQEFIKRCVAVAGDTVEVVENTLRVNGVRFDTLLAHQLTETDEFTPIKYASDRVSHLSLWHVTERLRNFGPHVVAPGHIFVMGDNRDNSEDSRLRGDVPLEAVRGRPMFIYWSVNDTVAAWNPLAHVRWERLGDLVR